MPSGLYDREDAGTLRQLVAHYGGDVNAPNLTEELCRVLPWDRIERQRKQPRERIDHGNPRMKRHAEIVTEQQQYRALPYLRV